MWWPLPGQPSLHNNVEDRSHLITETPESSVLLPSTCLNLPHPLLSPLQTTIPQAPGPRGVHTLLLNLGDPHDKLWGEGTVQAPWTSSVEGVRLLRMPGPGTSCQGWRAMLPPSSKACGGLYSSVGSVPAQAPSPPKPLPGQSCYLQSRFQLTRLVLASTQTILQPVIIICVVPIGLFSAAKSKKIEKGKIL